MNRHTASLSLAFAVPADDADLRRLLRENPMRGAITVGFTHEPDYFLSTGIAGAEENTLLARENGRLVAAGRCTTRPCWVNGEVRRVAYLGELRLDASVQGRWDIIRRGYAFFAAQYAREPADFCYTSIIADNTRARRLLERGAPGMPRYQPIGAYLTLLIPSATSHRPTRFKLTNGTSVVTDQLADFLNDSGKSRQLSAYWKPDTLSALAAHGLRLEDMIVLLEGERITACAGIWNQQVFRQIQIHGYRPLLASVRPLYNLLAPLRGQPRLPPAGTTLKQAFLTPFACRADCPGALVALIQAASHAAAQRGLDCLALGGRPDDPLLRDVPGRRYLSQLYRVDWPDIPQNIPALDARPCLPDIGLL